MLLTVHACEWLNVHAVLCTLACCWARRASWVAQDINAMSECLASVECMVMPLKWAV